MDDDDMRFPAIEIEFEPQQVVDALFVSRGFSLPDLLRQPESEPV
jgi:hypothetical protein